ncbi:TniQ family protein [Aminobacter anthyllidis]|uniref:TniQ family protein n=1 Tax=Aminobacter anthyllidis TaxID=1035067 RepID=A0A9X1D980_9HYPH|nr:TniQ family protein [Aminobacter anthyllidis]
MPPPFQDERLSSWMERIADVYRVSLDGLQAHVGWARPALQLESEPVRADMERIAAATRSSVERLFAMTFHDVPPRYRTLLRPASRETCPVCSRGMQRPQRLRAWSFAFSFRCDRHRQPLFGFETRGACALGGDEASAQRGAEFLYRWAMGRDTAAVPVGSVLSLLLSPSRKASSPAPWELARLPLAHQHEPSILSRRCRRPALRIVVPEFALAVPIYDQRLPSGVADLPNAPWAERYALAVGVARVLRNPVDAILRTLEASDDFGRKKVKALLDRWPAAIRGAVDCGARRTRTRGEGGRTAQNTHFKPRLVREPSNRDAWRDRADA